MAKKNTQLYTAWNVTKVPLEEYPRPQFKRDSYLCLNGLWQYAITRSRREPKWQGEILVPFSPECALSGVGRIVKPRDVLHYKRTVTVANRFIKDRVFLNFGAVDSNCEVYIDGVLAGSHAGGYNSFSVDITDYITSTTFTIWLVVTDSTDTSQYNTHGKQSLKPGGILYTPQSGIWQTVWLESANKDYIKNVKITPLYDEGKVLLNIDKDNIDHVTVRVFDDQTTIVELDATTNEVVIDMPEGFNSWTPENPYLYSLTLTSRFDKVDSYFAMRKFSLERDSSGYLRTMLNNQPYFHNGLLDQGYWPESLYTAPNDEALKYDIRLTKQMGFNMLRKHIKVEPMRWYYHCDTMGIIVWQDMPCTSTYTHRLTTSYLPLMGVRALSDKRCRRMGRSDNGAMEVFKEQYKEMIEQLYNVVSIAVWVPFNEGWGQFKAKEYYDYTCQLDNTRLVDHASGWHDQGSGDFYSMHTYFRPVKMPRSNRRAKAVTEFGGYSYMVDGHSFSQKSFGYKKIESLASLNDSLHELFMRDVVANIPKGLTASVYTQLSDVEEEINGLVTYDRQVVKVNVDTMREVNSKVKL